MFSNRVSRIDSSGIRKVFDLAAKLENPINLSIGQPDFAAEESIQKSACAAISGGINRYTQTQGIEPLREAIRRKYGIANGDKLDVFITSGVSGGLFLSYTALLDPGDEILIPDPYFCMYRDLAYLVNAEPVCYDTYPNFSLEADKIASCVTTKTKAIVINSPSNPTGYCLSEEELDTVIEIAKQHDLWVIYDEIYSEFCYDQSHTSALGQYDKTIILNGFSKSHSVTGWRVGYAVAPRELINEMLKIQQYTFVCAPAPLQTALIDAFEVNLADIRRDYTQKCDLICNLLKDKFEFVKPRGSFYLFPKSPTGSGSKFVEKCIENNLLVVPGHNVFSNQDTHFRISFATDNETLSKGAKILLDLVE